MTGVQRDKRDRTCFVPGCNSGYRSCKEARSLFRAPLKSDRRETWSRNIKRSGRETLRHVMQALPQASAAGLPSENIVYPRILESRDLKGEKTLYIRPGLVLSLEKSRVFSENFVFSIDGVNRHDTLMNGKDLEKNLYQDRNHLSVVFVDEEKGAVQVRGILDNKFSIEPIASSRRSEDDLVAHRLFHLDYIDNPLGDDSVQDVSLPAQDVGLSTPEVTGRELKNLPEEFLVEVRLFSDPAHAPNKTKDDLIKYFAIIMSQVNQMYKQLTKPKIQFIVLSVTKLTNYTFTKLFTRDNRTYIDHCKTIGTMNRYSNRMFNRTTQDAIVYVSGLPGAGGCSFGCRVCKKNPITTQSMMISHRTGLSDPKVLAHEMGHLLGMQEEGMCPGTYTPGNEKLRCKKEEHGYVLGSGKPPHYFSRCLQDQVRGCLMKARDGCFDLTGGPKIF